MRLYTPGKKVIMSPGDRYGRFCIIREVSSPSAIRKFECECDCGVRRVVWMNALRSGASQSCGCRAQDIRYSLQCNLKHGYLANATTARLYHVHYDMMKRCYNQEDAAYKSYGGRGIGICKAWRNSNTGLVSFIAWNNTLPKDERWQRGRSIDRINNERGYSPSNCRWATHSQQCRNMRTTLRIRFGGKTRALADVYDELKAARRIPANISLRIVYVRIKKGVPVKDALFTPHRRIRRQA